MTVVAASWPQEPGAPVDRRTTGGRVAAAAVLRPQNDGAPVGRHTTGDRATAAANWPQPVVTRSLQGAA